jgi:hypothetical protein
LVGNLLGGIQSSHSNHLYASATVIEPQKAFSLLQFSPQLSKRALIVHNVSTVASNRSTNDRKMSDKAMAVRFALTIRNKHL